MENKNLDLTVKEPLRYRFEDVPSCNMCGRESSKNKVLGLRLNCSHGLMPKSKTGVAVTVVSCNGCGLIYSLPLPVPFDLQDHYGIPADDYWVPEYFVINPEYFMDEINKAKELLQFRSGMKALDIGAGLGKCMIALSSAGFDVEGFEPSVTFREKALEKMGIDPNKLKFGMIEEMDYSPGSFDFITFGAVLEHLYNPDEAIRKALSWLRKDGVIQIEVPSSDWLIARLLNAYYRLTGNSYVTNISPMHSPFHLYAFTLDSFMKNAERSGYEVAYYEYSVCDLFHIPKLFHPFFRWYMDKTRKGMQLTVWLRKK